MKKSFFAAIVAAVSLVLGLGVGLSATPAMAGDGYSHHVVIHVDDNDKAKMNLALNNAANITKYYAGKGQKVQIEVVAYGPGLHMFRADTSPVAQRLESYSMEYENVGFAACANTMKGMAKKEGKTPELLNLDNIKVVPSGVVRIIERQDQGWHYIRP